MILLIDNYDSFTYNLVQMLEEMKQVVEVFRNNQISLEGIKTISIGKHGFDLSNWLDFLNP